MDKKIGAQYYTIRDYITTIEDFDASCKRISEIGYKAVQISGCPLEAKPMKEVLDKYGMVVYTTHKPFDDFKNNIDYIIDYNKTLGVKLCGIGGVGDIFKTKEDVFAFIEDVNKICKRLKEEGLYFGFHNHAHEFKTIDGKTVYDYLIENTDPETFNFIVDTCWCEFAGVDSASLIERLGKRAMVIHFKDLDENSKNEKMPVFKEIGYGCLNWDKIFASCEKSGTLYAVVEQDDCNGRNPFDSLKDSFDYLSKKGFN